MIRQNIILALRGIQGNRTRAILTMLIIAIGITALVGINTAIDSMNNKISTTFAALGSNTFTIRDGNSGVRSNRRQNLRFDSKPINYDEAIAYQRRFTYPALISLNARLSRNASVLFGDKKTNPNVNMFGADDKYMGVSGYELAYGRYFSQQESEAAANVVVLGNDIAVKLFDDLKKAIDTFVIVGSVRYRVLGVLKPKGSSFVGAGDNLLIVPLNTARRTYMTSDSRIIITVATKDVKQLDMAIDETKGLMRSIRRLKVTDPDDFSITKSDSIAKEVKNNLAFLTWIALTIGFITLLGAAVALMNIMLVSVTERTREIGVSKAIGATRLNVRLQFLTEALVICQLGGMGGIVLGIVAGNLVSILLHAPFIIPWVWIGLGILFCLIVGVAAGLYPAYKASLLDPVDALRYE